MRIYISRTVLLTIFTTLFGLIVSAGLYVFKEGRTLDAGEVAIVIFIGFILYVCGSILHGIEEGIAENNDLSDLQSFFIMEICFACVVSVPGYFLISPYYYDAFSKSNVHGFIVLATIFSLIAIIPSLIRRKKKIHLSEKEQKEKIEAWHQKINEQINTINQRYDSKLGSIDYHINCRSLDSI